MPGKGNREEEHAIDKGLLKSWEKAWESEPEDGRMNEDFLHTANGFLGSACGVFFLIWSF